MEKMMNVGKDLVMVYLVEDLVVKWEGEVLKEKDLGVVKGEEAAVVNEEDLEGAKREGAVVVNEEGLEAVDEEDLELAKEGGEMVN